jgi:hypothetical protein
MSPTKIQSVSSGIGAMEAKVAGRQYRTKYTRGYATGEGKHAWDSEGDYKIRAKAKDVPPEKYYKPLESDWSDPLTITVKGPFPLYALSQISSKR